jgi:hypothetical protein
LLVSDHLEAPTRSVGDQAENKYHNRRRYFCMRRLILTPHTKVLVLTLALLTLIVGFVGWNAKAGVRTARGATRLPQRWRVIQWILL